MLLSSDNPRRVKHHRFFKKKQTDLGESWSTVTKGNVSAVPGGQEVRPDVEGLVGELEEAEDAVCGRAAGVSVP